VRAGELHLSGVTLLAPHLTEETCTELLAAARHKSDRAPAGGARSEAGGSGARAHATRSRGHALRSGRRNDPDRAISPPPGAARTRALPGAVHGESRVLRTTARATGADATPDPRRRPGRDLRSRTRAPAPRAKAQALRAHGPSAVEHERRSDWIASHSRAYPTSCRGARRRALQLRRRERPQVRRPRVPRVPPPRPLGTLANALGRPNHPSLRPHNRHAAIADYGQAHMARFRGQSPTAPGGSG
jgi:hypothetical protein